MSTNFDSGSLYVRNRLYVSSNHWCNLNLETGDLVPRNISEVKSPGSCSCFILGLSVLNMNFE